MHITDPFKLILFLILFGVILTIVDNDCKDISSSNCIDSSISKGYPVTLPDNTIMIRSGVFIINGRLQYGATPERNTWSSENNLKRLKKLRLGD